MGSYIAFDVSLRSTSVHVVDEAGKCLWRGKCASEPDTLAAVVRKRAPEAVRVGLETGFLSTWLCHALAEAGLPVVCMDARQARADRGGAIVGRVSEVDARAAEMLAFIKHDRPIGGKHRASPPNRSLFPHDELISAHRAMARYTLRTPFQS